MRTSGKVIRKKPKQMRNIKYHIEEQIKKDISLEIELKKIHSSLGKTKRNETELLIRFIGIAKKYPTKDSVLLAFIDFLQLANSDNLIQQFNLDDINRLFITLM